MVEVVEAGEVEEEGGEEEEEGEEEVGSVGEEAAEALAEGVAAADVEVQVGCILWGHDEL